MECECEKTRKEETVRNNLLNILCTDEVYDSVWELIKKYVPDEETSELVKIVAVDSYFLHYSIRPRIVERNENETLERVRSFMLKYVRSRDYRKVKALTTLNEELSLVHSVSLLKELLKLLRCENPDFEENLKRAFSKANRDVFNAANVLELVGEMPGKVTVERLLKVVEAMEVEFAKEIVSLARDLSASVPLSVRISKKRDEWGDETAGYALTKRVEKAVAREFALPEELFLKKLAEGFITREKLSNCEGAFYVLLDASGSMKGERTVWSRAVALALLRIARRKRRKYFLRFFSDFPGPLVEEEDALESLLSFESGGGTNINLAIAKAIDDLEKLSDETNTIVLITDGKDDVSSWREELKRAGATLVSVMIQGHNEELKRTSDVYMKASLTFSSGKKLLRIVNFS